MMTSIKIHSFYFKSFFIAIFTFSFFTALSQKTNSFTPRFEGESLKIRGNFTMLGNSILGRKRYENQNFNKMRKSNDSYVMSYIDVDSDPNTFSSSSATLKLPEHGCSRIVYAGLYWGGVKGNSEENNYKEVKIKVPGSEDYITIGPESSPKFNYKEMYLFYSSVVNNDVYLNYAEITSLIDTPNGEYTVADVVANSGKKRMHAGWVLEIIYENQNEKLKYISSFDGYSIISPHETKEEVIDIRGFKTIPNGKVNARIGIAAMEGEYPYKGDYISFKQEGDTDFTKLSTGSINSSDNFFNSTISIDDEHITDRIPASHNTLGVDIDVFDLQNTNNRLLSNNVSNAQIKIGTDTDVFYLFLTTIAIEIIEPKVEVILSAEDIIGNNINNIPIKKGDTFYYNIKLKNVGNDAIKNLKITMDLPPEVSLLNKEDHLFLTNPKFFRNPITNTYDSTAHKITFEIPDEFVEVEDPEYEIEIKVKVSENCNDYKRSCANIISSQAFASYSGDVNPINITNQASILGLSTCNTRKEGATTFFVDIKDSCKFTEHIVLCDSSVKLSMQDGFTSYRWVNTNNPNLEIGNEKSLKVDHPGEYKVTVTSPKPCISYTKKFIVKKYGENNINPVINFAEDVETCPNDGYELPILYLHHKNDEQGVSVNIHNPKKITWEKLDENNCKSVDIDKCPSRNCTWNEVHTGKNYNISKPGKYRINVAIENGCNNFHYFNVYQNDLNPILKKKDIFCGNDGKIIINGVPDTYEYSINGIDFQSNNTFTISTANKYSVFIRLKESNNHRKVFVGEIAVRKKEVSIDIKKENISCSSNVIKKGSIRVYVYGAFPQYTYILQKKDSDGPFKTVNTVGPIEDNDFTFDGLSKGEYKAIAENTEGCTLEKTSVIENLSNLGLDAIVQQPITCTDGKIRVEGKNGATPYLYALYAKKEKLADGTLKAEEIVYNANNPEVQKNGDFSISIPGEYKFLIIDGNHCTFIGDYVIIESEKIDFNLNTINIGCDKNDLGKISVQLPQALQGNLTYSIDGTNFQSNKDFVNLNTGTYTITLKREWNGNTCTYTKQTTIENSFPLSVTAAIREHSSCDAKGEATVFFSNIKGGQAPYTYSFDGGKTYHSTKQKKLIPGNYDLVIKDKRNCTFASNITIPRSATQPNYTTEKTWNCDGTYNLEIKGLPNTNDYIFEKNGVANSSSTPHIFENISATQKQTFSIKYISKSQTEPATLMIENFGAGQDTYIEGISKAFCFKSQQGQRNITGVNICTNKSPHIIDGAYSVTQRLRNLFPGWLDVRDHTGNPNGRFLVVNLGNIIKNTDILYKNTVKNIIPHKNLKVKIWLHNLVHNGYVLPGYMLEEPNLTLEVQTTSGVLVSKINTGDVPRTNGWKSYNFELDPKNNTELNFIIKSNNNVTLGADVAIDDIIISQDADICYETFAFQVKEDPEKAFQVKEISNTGVSCPGAKDGKVTIEVLNFKNANSKSYTYSIIGIDGNPVSSPQTKNAITIENLSSGKHSIVFKNGSCQKTVEVTIDPPDILAVTGRIVSHITCRTNTNSTALEVVATGGTPPYKYQLEDINGVILQNYQNSSTFNNVSPGDYYIRVQDGNSCNVSTLFNVPRPIKPSFDISNSKCQQPGIITISNIKGNGNSKFSINGGPFQSLTEIAPNTNKYILKNLDVGEHTIEQKDSYGCGITKEIIIYDTLKVRAVQKSDLKCGNDNGAVDLIFDKTGNPGQGAKVYTLETSKNGVVINTQSISNSELDKSGVKPVFTIKNITSTGDYIFKVTDAKDCESISNVVTFTTPKKPEITSVTAEHIKCYGNKTGVLNITINKTSGVAPYQINISDSNGKDFGTQTTNLPAGTYKVKITDAYNCVSKEAFATINQNTPINPKVITKQTQCRNKSTILGSITVEASGGVGPYTYYLSNPNRFPIRKTYNTNGKNKAYSFTNLNFGDYTLNVEDSKGCVYTEEITINTSPDVLITTSGSAGCTTGTILVKANTNSQGASLGNGPFWFAKYPTPVFSKTNPNWNQGTSNREHTFTGLTPGVTYTFIVHDESTGCEYVQEATTPVATKSTLRISPPKVKTILCGGKVNAEITITVTDTGANPVSSASYQVLQSPSNENFRTGGNISVPRDRLPSGNITIGRESTISGIPPGKYYVLFTENGTKCTQASKEFIIKRPPFKNMQIDVVSSKNDNACRDAGKITVQAKYGTGNYFYFLKKQPDDGSTNIVNTTGVFEKLPHGNYTISVRDNGNGCGASRNITIGLDPSPEISVAVKEICGTAAHEAEIILDQAGIPPYKISVDGAVGKIVSNFPYTETNLSLGEHTFQVTDSNGCSTAKKITIFPKLEVEAFVSRKLNCSSTPNASINITVKGGDIVTGINNFTYSINGPTGNKVTDKILTSANFDFKDADTSGKYTITIKNTLGGKTCTKTTEVTVAPKIKVIPSVVNYKKASCSAIKDGEIKVSVADQNNGPIQFSIEPKTSSVQQIITDYNVIFRGLSGSNTGITYTITATDIYNCTKIVTQKMESLPEIKIPNLNIIQFGCTSNGNTKTNAVVSINTAAITGGSGEYTYRFEYTPTGGNKITQEGDQASLTIQNATGGSGMLEVRDKKGCKSVKKAFTIAPYESIDNVRVTISKNIDCADKKENITIDATTSTGNKNNLEYKKEGSTAWSNSPDFQNLEVGSHLFYVRHKNTQCITTVSHRVNEPNTLVVGVKKIQDVSCFGEQTGIITLEVNDTNYKGKYTYTIYNQDNTSTGITGNGTVNTTSNQIRLGAGSYYVRVSQDTSPKCSKDFIFSIIEPPNGALKLNLAQTSEITCIQNNIGAITANATDGWGEFQYQFKNGDTGAILSAFSNQKSITDLRAGNYEVTVKDKNNCEVTQTITLKNPTPITATTSVDNPTECYGSKDASITVTASGGSGTYTYELLSGGRVIKRQFNNPVLSQLEAGDYTLKITDTWNCFLETNITIQGTTEILANAFISKSRSCNDNQTEITIHASGGSGSYEFSRDGNNFTASNKFYIGLNPNPMTYKFYVRDIKGCVVESTTSVNTKPIVSLKITLNLESARIICNNQSNAVVYAKAENGLGNYRYQLMKKDNNITPIGGKNATGEFTNLGAGTYKIRVSSEDCMVDSNAFVISNPKPIILEELIVEHVSCYGEENGSVTFQVSGGVGNIQYARSPRRNQFFSTNTFSNLKAGTYEFIIQDENGCYPIFKTIEITEPEKLVVTIDPSRTRQEICDGDNDATIGIHIAGGVPPYSTSLNSSPNRKSNKTFFEGLEGGTTYTVSVEDAKGCTVSLPVTLDQPVLLEAEASIEYNCQAGELTPGNTVTVTVEDHLKGKVMFSLDEDTTNFQLENVFTNVPAGEHYINLFHANGCEKMKVVRFKIEETPKPLDLKLSNNQINMIKATGSGGSNNYEYNFNDQGFTKNNFFSFIKSGVYSVIIRDSYGCEVKKQIQGEYIDVEFPDFFSPNGDGKNDLWKPKNLNIYPNATIKIFDRYGRNVASFGAGGSWDGILQDTILPTGDYWYILKLNRKDDNREFIGHFTLTR